MRKPGILIIVLLACVVGHALTQFAAFIYVMWAALAVIMLALSLFWYVFSNINLSTNVGIKRVVLLGRHARQHPPYSLVVYVALTIIALYCVHIDDMSLLIATAISSFLKERTDAIVSKASKFYESCMAEVERVMHP